MKNILAILVVGAFGFIKYQEGKNLPEKINSEIASYSWYSPLLTAENGQEYNARFVLALYLEKQGLYTAVTTPYCTAGSSSIGTCYIGSGQQNLELLELIRSGEINGHLETIDADDILEPIRQARSS